MEIKGNSSQQVADVVLVYVTVSDQAEATRIARDVVSQRLAACANIVPTINSVYWWDGHLCEESECLLLLKTRSSLADKLCTALTNLHPYGVPAISVLPVSGIYPPYREWLLQQTREA